MFNVACVLVCLTLEKWRLVATGCKVKIEEGKGKYGYVDCFRVLSTESDSVPA